MSLVVNYLNQPDNLDPLGLTAAQVAQDPRQAGTNSVAFNTRRDLDNLQAGLVYEQSISDIDTLRGIVYVGQRNNAGYLAIPINTQNQVTGSGGVTLLGRDYYGAGLRWTRKTTLAGRPLTITTGAAPVAGILFKATPTLNFYANAGRSFETPTLIELAYRTTGSGPKLGLRPALSNHYEVGAKAFVTSDTRVELAVFQIDTTDEIVVESNTGGRSTFHNADKTRRRGVELGVESQLPHDIRAYLAATYLDATFETPFRTCPIPAPSSGPPCPAAARVVIPAGNSIPAIPQYLVYGDLSWRYEPWGLSTGLEVRWQGKAYVNDANSEFARSFTLVNLRAGLVQRFGSWKIQEYGRIDNLVDQLYIGGIVVNDANRASMRPRPAGPISWE